MVDRSKNRSSGYQHVLVESPTSPEMLAEVADTDGIMALMSNGAYNEELLELKEQLRKAFWRLVDTKLTDRQKEVVHLYAQGLTQTEIAKKLQVNQSSITKSMNGNCDYRNGRRTYGGVKKKIKRLAEQDEEVQSIILRIREIQEDDSLF
jgi:DNA-binding CsgD family transcriptional regulator